jgi:hypothetical protein
MRGARLAKPGAPLKQHGLVPACSAMPTRRTFLLAGIAGATALAAAGWLRSRLGGESIAVDGATIPALSHDAFAVVSALTPVILDGALPSDPSAAKDAVRDTIASVGSAIAGLPPAAQQELGELFALLGFAPARIALARVTSSWPEASKREIADFLEGWRTSRFLLFQSAHAALHQLVFAAWYGNPASWPAIGYPGPPGPFGNAA